MRHRLSVLFAASGLLAILGLGPAEAQTFNSCSTGADGAFNPSANTTLTLPSNGVFNFTTVRRFCLLGAPYNYRFSASPTRSQCSRLKIQPSIRCAMSAAVKGRPPSS